MDYWFTKSTKQILIDHMGIPNPSDELVKIMDSLVEEYIVDAWHMVHGFNEYEIKFIQNNFEYFGKYQKSFYKDFFERTKGMPNQREIAKKFEETKDLTLAIESSKMESFDASLLDFLEGKITEAKLVNWGVGQVMKMHPKKYSAAEIKAAIEKRFNVS
jgi:hypothetical protein